MMPVYRLHKRPETLDYESTKELVWVIKEDRM